ncbi:PHB depolymerase family esterase [Flavivirga rizhaonensis]|uniref:Uncharacterized protein n=1 Tax=Flavivirga rizhaonensis TaxID=2559571 RepID=A0A4V3P505_9FLAO|nr:PHB depolymerase family esterase [Flavivirga rizhaonensis]TGV03424.1 hypothetical protein EM932_07060 [Flavivirga rizhaonensis]
MANVNFKIACFFFLILMCFFQSCLNNRDIPINKIDRLSEDNDYIITDWQITGPFYSDTLFSSEIKKPDYYPLKSRGIVEESKLNSKLIVGLNNSERDASSHGSNNYTNSRYHNEQGYVDFGNYFKLNKTAVTYMSCFINSHIEQDVVFMVGAADGYKMFLNGDSICNSYNLRNFVPYSDIVHAKLKKGNNLLIIKLINTRKTWMKTDYNKQWKFNCKLTNSDRYYSFYQKIKNDYLKFLVVPKFYPLELQDVFDSMNPAHKISLFDPHRKRIGSDSSNLGVKEFKLPSSMKPGLYEAEIYTKKDTFSQQFYYGDLKNGIENLLEQANNIIKNTSDVKLKINLQALVKRHQLIEDHYTDRKGIHIETSEDGINYSTLTKSLIVPTRWLNLNHKNFLRLSPIADKSSKISEISFYTEGRSSSRINPKRVSDTIRFSEITDNNDDTFTVLRKKEAPLVIEFDSHKKPLFARIIPDQQWHVLEKKYLFIYSELYDILDKLKKEEEPFKDVSGNHIRSFISRIDNKPQHYFIQTPKEDILKQKKMPLIVQCRFYEKQHLDFLKSVFVSNIEVIDLYSYWLNENKCIMVTPSGRTYSKAIQTPIAEADVLAVIEEVKKDYNIDASRIYLYGICSGSKLALSLASKYPDKFAAVGIASGAFKTRVDNKWEQFNLPATMTSNVYNLPVYAFNIESDNHSPIEIMKTYVDEARKNEIEIDFDVYKNHHLKAFPFWYRPTNVLSSFQNKTLSIPKKIIYETAYYKYNKAYWISVFPEKTGDKGTIKAIAKGNNITVDADKIKKFSILTNEAPIDKNKKLIISLNGESKIYMPPYPKELTIWLSDKNLDTIAQKNEFTEGPIIDIFRNHFILIKGSLGSKSQRISEDSLANKFINIWENSYYVKPELKTDYEVMDTDIQSSNLILLGNQYTNKIFKAIYKQTPLKVEKDYIELDGRKFKGNALGYYMVYPNPLNPKKYMVLIGGNDLSKVTLDKRNLAEDGFFDYEIFNYRYRIAEIIDKGYFNQYWKLSNKNK